MQKLITALLVFGVLVNFSFTAYIYTEFQKASNEIRAVLSEPFEAPGKGLKAYDMSTPESSLRSFKSAIEAFDIQAGIDLLKIDMRSNSTPYLDFLFEDNAKLEVVKAHLIKDTSSQNSAGKVLAFIRVTTNGVESRDVQAFEKKEGMYMPSSFYISEYSKDDWTDEDKYLDRIRNSWITTGKL